MIHARPLWGQFTVVTCLYLSICHDSILGPGITSCQGIGPLPPLLILDVSFRHKISADTLLPRSHDKKDDDYRPK